MSDARERKSQGRLKAQRQKLLALLDQGEVLVASGETPGQPGVRQTVSLHPAAEGTVSVHVERYLAHEWDQTRDDFTRVFGDVEAALTWLEETCAVTWTALHVPEARE